MIFDDGVVFICDLENTAPNGRMPQMQLVKKDKLWFAERTVGASRFYQARGVNEQVDMLIRVIGKRSIKIGQYAMLGNGEQFHINNVQHIIDDVNNLRYTDLTLERVEDYFDVAE